MTHPEDLLADYVDDALDQEQRAAVDAHLSGCALCREEIQLARAATASLASLDEVPVPFGATGPVLAEAGRRFERRGVVWQRLQWAAGLAAAAAFVLVVALNVGGDDSDQAARPAATSAGAEESAPEAADATAPSGGLRFLGLERQPGVNYDEAGVEAVARDAAGALADAKKDRTAELAGGAMAFAAPGEGRRCVERTGLTSPSDPLIRLIEAEFEGVPAYIAVYAQGPGAGQPPDHVVIYVVATEDCRILTTASLRI